MNVRSTGSWWDPGALEALLVLAEEDGRPPARRVPSVKAEDRALGRLAQVDGLEDRAGLGRAAVDQDRRRRDDLLDGQRVHGMRCGRVGRVAMSASSVRSASTLAPRNPFMA
jgi:hypothetical protein